MYCRLSNILSFFQAAKEKCAAEFKGKVTKEQLDEAFTLIKDAYVSQSSDVFDKLGRFMKKNILHIPQDINLPEDRPHISGRNYSGEKLTEDLKKFEDFKKEVANLKYRKSVLKDKLSNLEIVAERQRKLMSQVNQYNAEKSEISMVDQQMDNLKEKLALMKPVLQQIENNVEPQKRKLEMGDDFMGKKMKIGQNNKEN